jgi:hypothetical protein
MFVLLAIMNVLVFLHESNLGSAPPPIYLEVCVYLFQAGIHGLVDHAQSAGGSFSEDFSGGHQAVSPCRLALNCLLEQ